MSLVIGLYQDIFFIIIYYESDIAQYESDIAQYESDIAQYEPDVDCYKCNSVDLLLHIWLSDVGQAFKREIS